MSATRTTSTLAMTAMAHSVEPPTRVLFARWSTSLAAMTVEAALPSFGVPDRVALVTGAARGLGRAISLALAEAGAHVAVGLRDIDADAGLAAEVEARGRRVLKVQLDVSEVDQIGPAVDAVVAEFGRLDILVNNAGV